LKLAFEFKRLELAGSDGGDDFRDRPRAEHDVNAELLPHPTAFGKLREAPHQADGQAAPLFFFAKLAEQSLGLFDGLAAHGARVDEHQVGFTKVVNERVARSGKLGLNGVSVVLIHLTTECHYVRSHELLVLLSSYIVFQV
jgi:hypothetical protein